MKILTSELIDLALDWAAAKCEGHPVGLYSVDEQWERFVSGCSADDLTKYADEFARVKAGLKPELCKIHSDGYKCVLDARSWKFSTDWAQGGPIIGREKISTWWDEDSDSWKAAGTKWMNTPVESAEFEALPAPYDGPTPLIAAMRCYVASRLGDEIEIPKELLK